MCDNVVSTVRFSLLKLVKFSFFLLFATGFISPVNKDYHYSQFYSPVTMQLNERHLISRNRLLSVLNVCKNLK